MLSIFFLLEIRKRAAFFARNYHIGKVTFALKSTRRASSVGLASWLSAGLTEGSEERDSGDAMRGRALAGMQSNTGGNRTAPGGRSGPVKRMDVLAVIGFAFCTSELSI